MASFLLSRTETLTSKKKIARLFQDASKLKITIQCHHHVISEFVYVSNSIYNCSNKDINHMITDFIAMPGIEMITEVNFSTLLQYWPSQISDYGDAVIAAQCKNSTGSTIATFDNKFKKAIGQIGLPLHEL